jgi:hypothetical protein
LNAYVIRHVCFIEFTGKTNAMHGFWVAIARLAENWWLPSWWPYWYGGMPFEYAYAPLVPGLTAIVAKVASVPHGQAFHIVAALAFCLGPVAVFALAWQWCGRISWSFFAAIVYSLSAPTNLLAPDGAFHWMGVADARRAYVTFTWDEAPHQMALSFACGAAAMLLRRKVVSSALLAALAGLASPFGLTAFALLSLCTVAVAGGWRLTAASGAIAYCLLCPYLPPSLIGVIGVNAQQFQESAWGVGSWVSLAVVTAGAAALWRGSRASRPELRFALILSWVPIAMAILHQRWNLHFLPQAGRYKAEAEVGLALLFSFAAARAVNRLPRHFAVALACIGIVIAARQTVEHRRFSRRELQVADVTRSIEYRVARWLEANRPSAYVMAPGSIAQWMNAFSRVRQFSGGSFPTAPDPEQQRALFGQFQCTFDDCLATLRAYGVDTLVVSGPRSREFWKPYRDASIFEGRLPLLWREEDVSIYDVPGTRKRPVGPWVPGLEPWVCRAISGSTIVLLALRGLRSVVRRRQPS